MSTNYACSVMFGLPYKTLLERLPEEFDLDEMIHDGDLDVGSIYYDSRKEDNIVGFEIQSTSTHIALDFSGFEVELGERTKGHPLEHLAYELNFEIYLTLNIT